MGVDRFVWPDIDGVLMVGIRQRETSMGNWWRVAPCSNTGIEFHGRVMGANWTQASKWKSGWRYMWLENVSMHIAEGSWAGNSSHRTSIQTRKSIAKAWRHCLGCPAVRRSSLASRRVADEKACRQAMHAIKKDLLCKMRQQACNCSEASLACLATSIKLHLQARQRYPLLSEAAPC